VLVAALAATAAFGAGAQRAEPAGTWSVQGISFTARIVTRPPADANRNDRCNALFRPATASSVEIEGFSSGQSGLSFVSVASGAGVIYMGDGVGQVGVILTVANTATGERLGLSAALFDGSCALAPSVAHPVVGDLRVGAQPPVATVCGTGRYERTGENAYVLTVSLRDCSTPPETTRPSAPRKPRLRVTVDTSAQGFLRADTAGGAEGAAPRTAKLTIRNSTGRLVYVETQGDAAACTLASAPGWTAPGAWLAPRSAVALSPRFAAAGESCALRASLWSPQTVFMNVSSQLFGPIAAVREAKRLIQSGSFAPVARPLAGEDAAARKRALAAFARRLRAVDEHDAVAVSLAALGRGAWPRVVARWTHQLDLYARSVPREGAAGAVVATAVAAG
jgi:hypothetical protein